MAQDQEVTVPDSSPVRLSAHPAVLALTGYIWMSLLMQLHTGIRVVADLETLAGMSYAGGIALGTLVGALEVLRWFGVVRAPQGKPKVGLVELACLAGVIELLLIKP